MENVSADFTINESQPLQAEYTLGESEHFDCSFELFASGTVWGSIDGNIENQTDLWEILNSKADTETVNHDLEVIEGEISDLSYTVNDNYTTLVNRLENDELAISNNANEITSINNTILTYGDIVTYDASNFATSAQGALANTALQPGDNITELNNNAGYTTNVGTVTSVNNTEPDANGNVTITIPDSATWGNITGDIDDQTDLKNALDGKYDASNPNGYITNSALANYVTTNTAQTIASNKSFHNAEIITDNMITLNGSTSLIRGQIGINYRNLLKLNSSGITLGSINETLTLNGNATRPKYNSSDIALYSDVPTDTNDLTNGAGFLANNATGVNALAVGNTSQSTAEGGVAVGYGSKANSTYSTAIGQNASATNTNTTVIGRSAKATQARAIAIGSGAEANAQDAIAIKGINNTASTFQVYTYNMLDMSTGLIPDARISTNLARTADVTTADNNLQSQIDAITASSDVTDIVGTYAELQAYDTSTLPPNSIIKVLQDEHQNNETTYYRWVITGGVGSWVLIGEEGPYYTKSEANSTFVPQTRTVNGKALSSNITLDASDVGALPSSTVIPVVDQTYNPSSANAQSGIAINGAKFIKDTASNGTRSIGVGSSSTNSANFTDATLIGNGTSCYCPINKGILIGGIGIGNSGTLTNSIVLSPERQVFSGGVSNSFYVNSKKIYDLSTKLFEDSCISSNIARTSAIPTESTVSGWGFTKNTGTVTSVNNVSPVSGNVTLSIPTATSDLTNDSGFITSSDLPTNYVTTDTDQNITGTKTFVGQKKIAFKQSGTSDKLGFTLYNNSGTEKGYLEYNPSNTVDSVPLMTLGNYASASAGLTHVGFRKYSSISGASGAYNLLAPLISDAKTPFSLTTTYTNFYLPLGFTDGNTTVKTAKSGVVDLSSLIPTATSDLTNDSGFITSIPTATSSTLGMVQPDNTTITIDGNGVISASGASRNIGEIVQSTIPLTDAGLHLLDGSLLTYGSYQAFIDYIADLYNSGNYDDIFSPEANWQQAVSDYGVCGKFVYDSVNQTVRLPKITGFTEGTIDPTVLGDLIEAGLPNITGYTSWQVNGIYSGSFGNASANNTNNGALYVSGSGKYGGVGTSGADNTNGGTQINLDASRSSSLYGNSSTVQPQAIKVLYYIVIANTTKTAIQVDIDEIATDLNGKADVDLSNVPTSKGILTESYVNGTSWYRVYSDGWCEQGGEVTSIANNTETTVNLLKSYASTNYCAYATVLRISNDIWSNHIGVQNKTTSSFGLMNYRSSGNANIAIGATWYACGYIR